MTDWEDVGDTAWVVGMVSNNPIVAFLALVLMALTLYMACNQREACAETRCPALLAPMVVKGECLCVQKAQP